MASPDDIDRLKPWFSIMLRANLAASEGGPGILTFHVMIDEYGRPCAPWTAPKVTHLEPRGQAEKIIEELDRLDDGELSRILELLAS